MTQTLAAPRSATTRSRPRVALYARISDDKSGEEVGVDRQIRSERERAERDGYEVVAEFVDNSISALQRGKRPEYARLLELVASGGVEHVLAWQQSRLFRNRLERAAAIELFDERRVGILFVKAQDLDLSSAYGRAMAGLLGEFDTMESEVKSERITASAADLARRGRANGKLGYGWKKVDGRFVEHPEQGPIVREIVKRLLSGDALMAVVRDLNERGVPSPNGGQWVHTTMRKMAKRASNAGLRIYHRGREDEQMFPAQWPALIERDEWERLNLLLDAPDRRTNTGPRPGRRRHLLTNGVGACGVCGGKLRARREHYACAGRGCVGRSMDEVDRLVRMAITEYMREAGALDWLYGDEEEAKQAAEEAAALRRRLEEAADSFAEGRMTIAQMDKITARLQPQIQKAESRREQQMRVRDVGLLLKMSGTSAVQAWQEANVAQRRVAVETVLSRVVVNRSTDRARFNPDDIVLEWRK